MGLEKDGYLRNMAQRRSNSGDGPEPAECSGSISVDFWPKLFVASWLVRENKNRLLKMFFFGVGGCSLSFLGHSEKSY